MNSEDSSRRQKFEKTEDRSACGAKRRRENEKPSARVLCPLEPSSRIPVF
ncbi:MAG: hypothetical protein LBD06_07830 [Candidatus Accumulibacter sp.]|nr:hypothetical protein [Accumulibacter sp.]